MPVGATAVLAMLASSTCWAGFDALRKVLAARLRPTPLAAALTLGQLPLFLVWVAAADRRLPTPGYWPPALVTVGLNSLAVLLFVRAVRVSPLSATIPFLSFTPVFSTLFAAGLLGERPDLRQGVGIVLVVLGALALSLRREAGGLAGTLQREPGSLMMVGVALLWSLTAPLDKIALAHAPAPVHGAIQCAGVAAVLLLLLAARGRLAELRGVASSRLAFGAALLAGTLGLGLQFVAIHLALVGIVESVKRCFGMASSVVTGRLVFSEPITAGKWLAVALMGSGVMLILI